MHSRNYIHRDLTPDNIMMGIKNKSNIVHLIDFGLMRSVMRSKSNKHIAFMHGKNLVGTCRFVSINAHMGFELSRRDDLLTLVNIIVYLYTGDLPWSQLPINPNSARYRDLGKLKERHLKTDLFEGCPKLFKDIHDYSSQLAFEKMPNYKKLKQWVRSYADS